MGILKLHTYLWIFILLASKVGCQQKQHFRATPKDQDVIEGTTVIIDCEVGNQGGRVQWAKDGFVLGFNRSIPGYPRYEMIGSKDDGKHHLKIYNATLIDDAAYQCQVSPADGHPPIRATGKLNVLMAPTSVRLMGMGRKQSQLEVKEGTEIILTCVVENAKPVAGIIWLKNNRQIKIEDRNDQTEESILDRRNNAVSKISLKATSRDDGSRYTCRARHQALSARLQSTIQLSVLYPPGPPIITGYTEGETIRAGEERMFKCKSKGGNPLADIVWYKDNEVIDSTSSPHKSFSQNDYQFISESEHNGATFSCEVRSPLLSSPLRSSINLTVIFPPENVVISGANQARAGDNVTLRCSVENSNPPASISWVVDGKPDSTSLAKNHRTSGGGWRTVSALAFSVPPVDRNIMFTCHATNEALQKTSVDTYMLSVLRPPKPPEIYGYSTGMGIRTGEEQTIKCVSRGGNPPSTIQWYRNNKKIPSKKKPSPEASSAEITILAEPTDDGVELVCETFNEAAPHPVRTSITLVVYFSPEDILIKQKPTKLKAGGQASLSCTAGPSNPPAEISWYRGVFKMNGHLENKKQSKNKGTSVTNVLLLNLTSGDDGLTYTCQATNSALQINVKKSVTLRVTYPPEFISSTLEIVDIKIGESKVVNFTAIGNPTPIHYSWSRQGSDLIKDTPNNHGIVTYRSSRVVPEGPLLYLNNVTLEDAGIYNLEAGNAEGISTTSVRINVLYGAVIKATTEVTSSSGDRASLICKADGNPLSEDMISWERHNYDFSRTTQTFRGKEALLEIPNVSRNDTGYFTCVVNNGVGKEARQNATLIVKSKPYINKLKTTERAAAKIGATGVLACEAEGAPEISFSWTRNGEIIHTNRIDGKYVNETYEIGLSTYIATLEIRRVTERDYGHYSCIAKNPLGTATYSIQFTTPQKPDPPMALKVINESHDSVTLQWVPGFDGGVPQYFRIRYRQKSSSNYEKVDVLEHNIDTYTVTGLRLDTEYFFSIMSWNEIGQSDYFGDYVRASTLDVSPPTPVPSSNVGREDTPPLPALWVVIVVLIASALLVLNVSAIVCIIRRRRKKRDSKKFKKGLPAKPLHGLPSTIPLSGVSSNHPNVSDQSSKSTANTMYAPSSYNDTMVGETLSSISEKSRESSYNQEDSVGEYDDQEQKHGHNYIIEQIDPPPEYASQTPSSQPSSANYNPHNDDYAEVLRRNAYNHQLGKGTMPRPQSRATHYSTSPESRGYMSYSYTPSPTVPNGGLHYRSGSAYQGHDLHNMPFNINESESPCAMGISPNYSPSMQPLGLDNLQTLGLDTNLPPPMGLEQHSITSDHASIGLDHHSITVDHSVMNLTDSSRNGEIRMTQAPLSTFNPTSTPNDYNNSEIQGHLV